MLRLSEPGAAWQLYDWEKENEAVSQKGCAPSSTSGSLALGPRWFKARSPAPCLMMRALWPHAIP